MASVDKVKISDTTYDVSPSATGTLNGYTSGDSASPSSWSSVDVISTSDTNSSIFNKITTMVQNVRWLYTKLGNDDFSDTGSDTITGALSTLQSGLDGKSPVSHTHTTMTLPVSSNQVNSESYVPTSALLYSMVQRANTVADNVTAANEILNPPHLNDMTWEQIRAISDAGTASNYFSVGDTKTIVINGTVGATTFSNLSVDVFILGFDHNSTIEGTNTIHFKIGKIDGVQVGLCDANYLGASSVSSDKKGWFRICTGGTANNSGGWASCSMRTTILGSDSTPENPTPNSLLSALPSDLLAVMKPATKYSDNTGGGSNTASYVTATIDYLFLIAEFESAGRRAYANSAEQNYQARYDYYKAGNSRVHYKHDETFFIFLKFIFTCN